MDKYIDTKVLATVILGVIAAGLIFNFAGDIPLISDAKKSFG